jgi:hypothetical protein
MYTHTSVYVHFLAYFPYFEKIKVGLLDHLVVCVSTYVYPPPTIIPKQWLSKHIPVEKFWLKLKETISAI